MDILGIFSIVLIFLVNFNLWYRSFEIIFGSKNIDLVYSTTILIMLSLNFWEYANECMLLFLFILTLSYTNLCIVFKKNCNNLQYTIIFIILTIFYLLWITVLFGKYYYDNNLIDTSIYTDCIEEIYNKYDWFPVYDFHLSIIFFEIAFEKYFIIPEKIILNDVQFVQFVSGIIISGTIISGTLDFIKKLIFPKNK